MEIVKVIRSGEDPTVISSFQSLSLIEEVNDGEGLRPGAVIAGCLQFTFWGNNGTIEYGDTLQYFSDSTDITPYNTYYVNSVVKQGKGVYAVTAYDAISKLDVDVSDIFADDTYSNTFIALFTQVAARAGVSFNVNSSSQEIVDILNSTVQYTGEKPTLTARQAFSYLAEMLCCYCVVVNDIIQLQWYYFVSGKPVINYTIKAKENGLILEDYKTDSVDKVYFSDSQKTYFCPRTGVTATNEIYFSDNPIFNMLSTEAEKVAVCDNLYIELVNSDRYTPGEIHLFSDNDYYLVGEKILVYNDETETFLDFLITSKEKSENGIVLKSAGVKNYGNSSSVASDSQGNNSVDNSQISYIDGNKIIPTWVELPLVQDTDFAVIDNMPLSYTQIGNTVIVKGKISCRTTATSGQAVNLSDPNTVIPKPALPTGNTYALCPAASTRFARVFVNTNGNVKLDWVYNFVTGNEALNTKITWLDITIIYHI